MIWLTLTTEFLYTNYTDYVINFFLESTDYRWGRNLRTQSHETYQLFFLEKNHRYTGWNNLKKKTSVLRIGLCIFP